jgi:hypothetical protein
MATIDVTRQQEMGSVSVTIPAREISFPIKMAVQMDIASLRNRYTVRCQLALEGGREIYVNTEFMVDADMPKEDAEAYLEAARRIVVRRAEKALKNLS